MLNIKVIFMLVTCLVATIFTLDVKCTSKHRAYVWNCQTLLDNWELDDNTFYNPQEYKCKWSGVTWMGTIACKYLENDSCALVISYSAMGGTTTLAGYTGAELKQFVQQSINQCANNNELSSYVTGMDQLTKGGLCLINHGSASSCS